MDIATATNVAVTGELSGMRARLPDGYELRGRVTDRLSGQGLGGFDVAVKSSTCSLGGVMRVSADQTGAFSARVSQGSYILQAIPVVATSILVSTYGRSAVSCAQGEAIEVRGADVSGVDVQVLHGYVVSGFIIDASSGAPISSARAAIYQGGPDASGGDNEAIITAVSNAQGRWAVVLADGTYRVVFRSADSAYREQWWDNALSFPRAKDLVVSGRALAGINANMAKQ